MAYAIVSKSPPSPYVRIVEQPDKSSVRFRYASEGRSTAIQGENSTPLNKTFPSIEVVNYTGPILVAISCVTYEMDDERPKPHPHNLISTNNDDGVFVERFYNIPNVPLITDKLCIQCVKKDAIQESLKNRERLQRDPFKTGFSHRSNNFDLSVVCLAFEVFIDISKSESNSIWKELPPIISNPIYDKKSDEDPHIYAISECKSPIEGGKKIMIFTSKIPKAKEFIIEFFAQSLIDQSIVWQDTGKFERKDVHRGTGIIFKTPPFPIQRISSSNVDVYVQLKRLEDSKTSHPIYFNYIEENNQKCGKNVEKLTSEDFNLSEELNPYLEQEYNNFNSNDSLMDKIFKDGKDNQKLNSSNAVWLNNVSYNPQNRTMHPLTLVNQFNNVNSLISNIEDLHVSSARPVGEHFVTNNFNVIPNIIETNNPSTSDMQIDSSEINCKYTNL